jgi:hypothetical protein
MLRYVIALVAMLPAWASAQSALQPVTIPSLTAANPLVGSELMLGVQRCSPGPWCSVSISAQQLTTYALGNIAGTGNVVITPTVDGISISTTSGGGNVSAVGTPTYGQLAQWTGPLTIEGISATSALPALTGDVISTAGTAATTVVGLNGTLLSGLATGLLKNTNGTGVPSIATGTDVLTTFSCGGAAAKYPNGAGACSGPLAVTATDTGSANAYVLTTSPSIGSAVTGQVVQFTPGHVNTGASTTTFDGGSALAIIGQTGAALTGGELSVPTWLQYTGSQWQIVGTGPTPDKARAPAEILAGVTPVNYWVPAYTSAGTFYPDRYETNATPGTTDMQPGIQAAVNVAIQAGGGNVVLRGSNYATNSTITLASNIHLVGQSRLATTLTPSGTFNAITVHGTSEIGAPLVDAAVERLQINGAALTGNGLDINFCGLRCHFSDLYILNVNGIGMKISGSYDHMYERIEVRNCASFGIQTYQQEVAYDGVYNPVTFLRFLDVDAVQNNFGVLLAMGTVTGTYSLGETVTQASSGATGVVTYYDFANYRVYVKSVTGTFNTSNIVTGGTSGATATPATISNSGTSMDLTQWDEAGGDNLDFISIKASQGLVGLDISRASNNLDIRHEYFDGPSPGIGAAVQTSNTRTGFTQFLTVGNINSNTGQIGANVLGGQNLYLGTIQMNSSGTPVVLGTGVTGPIFLTAARTTFTDPNVPHVVYPTENIITYTPSFGGTGGSPSLGNGSITGEITQHGNAVVANILLTVGSTTVMPTTAIQLGLPASLGVHGSDTYFGTAQGTHSSSVYNASANAQGTAVSVTASGTSGNWNSTVPYTWATGDTLRITISGYLVN